MMEPAEGGESYARRGSYQGDNDDPDVNYRALEIDGQSPVSGNGGGPPLSLALAADALGDSMQSVMTAGTFERGSNGTGGADVDPRASVLSGFGTSGSGGTLMTDANARCVYVNDPAKNLAAGFCDNKVVTAKYTKLNFIPRFFFGRLSQVANFYFLLVGAGQIISSISSTQGIPYQWIVLAIVLSVDAVFAAIEDSARHKADAKMNARTAQVFDANSPTCFREVIWRDVRVGDILKVSNYEAIPADVLLLAVSEPDPTAPVGICFVETKSLDGETNLKVRQALSCTFSQLGDPRSLGQLPGRVICEKPNHDVNNFSGRFEPQDGLTIPVDLKNVALRGSVIRNTPFVYSLVLNTGSETKIMQSATATPSKTSKILAIVNRGIGILMAILIALCVLGAVICSVWVAQNHNGATYLMLDDLSGTAPFRNDVLGWFIYLGYFWILIASFVPITLYVTIAIVKSYQTFFLNRDIEMYDPVTDTPALVRNADLNDDLGQVTHIFSDKTGTLTANEMDFRKMCVNGVSYGRGTTEIGRVAQRRLGKELSASDVLADNTPCDEKVENVRFIDPSSDFIRDSDPRNNPVQAAWIEAFFVHLAVCHSVVVEQREAAADSHKTGASDEPTTNFSASSPDELALVSGANFFGYSFVGRKNGAVSIKVPDHQATPQFQYPQQQPVYYHKQRELVYELLEMIEFTSTRKRMSVLVRTPDKRILLLTKGADAVIFPRLHSENCDPEIVSVTTQHLERYATEGLRTLVIAQKEIPEEAYQAWSADYRAALSDLEEVAKQKRGDPNRIEDLEECLEFGLELLGATAIEDRLQDGVTATIADLAKAGVKIWILTGDKEETAINIGFACQLLNNDMERLIINADSVPTSSALYDLLLERCVVARRNTSGGSRSQAIIIDGSSLSMVFSHHRLSDLFLEASQHCAAVICCRVSPKQKAQVVRLYKTNVQGCRSLAIGDGANDVGMIQEAHIGVGISGHEGMQAVNASDFAIAQFRFLKRLLLVHGHWNYRRMAKLAVYIVYKNIILYTAEFVLSLLSGGSGTLYYNNMWINGYNVFWSSIPISVVGVLEQDCPASIAMIFPGLYHNGAQGELFSLRIFTQWILEALYEGAVCALAPALLVGQVDSRGVSYSRDVCGGISYSCMIMVGWAKLALNMVAWNYVTAASFAFSFGFWYLSGYIISVGFPTSVSDVAFPYLFTLPEFYLIAYICLLLCLGRDILYKAYKREMRPEYYHVLQEFHIQSTKACEVALTSSERVQWEPPELRYRRFETNLAEVKPAFDQIEQQQALLAGRRISGVKPSGAEDRHRAYTGFAFSTQVLEDRFLNPLRDMVLPVRGVASALGTRFRHGHHNGQEDAGKTFEDRVRELPVEQQEIYEIQRFQVFTGWGSSQGHLLVTDPPRFTNSDMSDGAATFNLHDWVIDTSFGGTGIGMTTDEWQYATKFKDFLREDAARRRAASAAAAGKPRRRIKKKLNKLVGRAVRRRRWVRKDKVLSDIVAAMAVADGASQAPLSGGDYAPAESTSSASASSSALQLTLPLPLPPLSPMAEGDETMSPLPPPPYTSMTTPSAKSM